MYINVKLLYLEENAGFMLEEMPLSLGYFRMGNGCKTLCATYI